MADLAATRERVAEFEEIIEAAKRAIWAGDPPEVADSFLSHDPVLQWKLLDRKHLLAPTPVPVVRGGRSD
jgi:hypothetical protein